MPTQTLDRPRPTATPGPATHPERHVERATATPRRRPGSWLAAALVAGGLIAMAASAVLVVSRLDSVATGTAPVVTGEPPAQHAITVDGAGGVSVVNQVYEPGQESAWHAHSGIHAVAVLTGTLTVYDADCRAQTYGRDRPYIGGQELHLVRNETAEPVEMVVTYVSAARSDGTAPSSGTPACWENGDE